MVISLLSEIRPLQLLTVASKNLVLSHTVCPLSKATLYNLSTVQGRGEEKKEKKLFKKKKRQKRKKLQLEKY